MTVVDAVIFETILELLGSVFTLLATIASIAMGAPWFLIIIPPFIAVYWFIQHYYRKSSIEVQRIEAVSRAPVYSDFSESLSTHYPLFFFSYFASKMVSQQFVRTERRENLLNEIA